MHTRSRCLSALLMQKFNRIPAEYSARPFDHSLQRIISNHLARFYVFISMGNKCTLTNHTDQIIQAIDMNAFLKARMLRNTLISAAAASAMTFPLFSSAAMVHDSHRDVRVTGSVHNSPCCNKTLTAAGAGLGNAEASA